jgi:ADP-heptose:LPS heptosyltransferase
MLDFKRTYTFPFKSEIPSYVDKFLDKKFLIKARVKFIKRYFYILIKGQKSLEVYKINKKYKNILWINLSAPSLGDSLMDLSSRVLLENKKIDLLTDIKNAHLYSDDLFFSKIMTHKKEVKKQNYDLIIVDSYSSKSIKIKTDIGPKIPYVGLYGYYNGPEVNRVLFSFHQINNLTGYLYPESKINDMAKSSIFISIHDKKTINLLKLPKNFIAIVIGGEWNYRTYKKWVDVIEKLFLKDSQINLILIGSQNAKETEKEILESFPDSNIQSYVSKLTFNQTAQLIKQATFLFCCDGGLMHAANAVGTIIIPLFARLEAEMQLTISSNAFPLYDSDDVNNISVEKVIESYIEAVNFDYSHHLS